MTETGNNYDEAVKTIKIAILQSQYEAARSVNEKQLMLYYGIGKYISQNSREGFWGKSAIETVSARLQQEMPGLRGFSARNMRNMRIFYEEWKSLNSISLEYMTDVNGNLADTSAKLSFTDLKQIWQTHLPKSLDFSYEDFFSVSFSHHIYIISKVKNLQERLFYIKRSSENHYSYDTLKERIASNEYQHQSQLPNNFLQTISPAQQALKAINVFKDEYLLDFINVEELGARDDVDIDERVLENAIVHNIKNFILTFGKDFAFIRNQYHLDAFGIDQFIDLLFFNRSLNCLVAVELKKGPFKTAYLGQLSGYLSILDGFEKKPHENPSISLILCKDMEKSFVDYVIRDYSKPMGVATYKTSKDMSEELRKALPDIESLKKLLEKDDLF